MIDKNTIIKSFESICDYMVFQMRLVSHGYGIEDSNVGNQLLLSCIQLIKEAYGNNEEVNTLIDEFCWEGGAGLHPITVTLKDKPYWIGSIEDLVKTIEEILSTES